MWSPLPWRPFRLDAESVAGGVTSGGPLNSADEPRPPEHTPPAPTYVRRAMNPYLRVFLYIVGYFVVGLAFSMVVAIIAGTLAGLGVVEIPLFDDVSPIVDMESIVELISPYLFPIAVVSGIYTILYTLAFMWIVDRKSLLSLGLYRRRGWLSDFAKGGTLALLILGVIFSFSLVTGDIVVEGFARPAPETTPIAAYLLGAIVAFIIVGLYEEIMFRGYILQTLATRSGKIGATIVSSVLFAVLHGANPGADVFGIFNTVIIGVVLCVLYFRTGSLWMPVGFHFAWNFSLGYLYSLPVSGLPIYGILNVIEVETTSRISGGSYGPEAGLACTVALAVWGAWLIWKGTGRKDGNST